MYVRRCMDLSVHENAAFSVTPILLWNSCLYSLFLCVIVCLTELTVFLVYHIYVHNYAHDFFGYYYSTLSSLEAFQKT